MEVVFFDQDYFDIPLQDMPDAGNLIICHDPQKRLKTEQDPITWAVVKTTSNEGGAPPKALGLFWDREQAEFYANALTHEGA